MLHSLELQGFCCVGNKWSWEEWGAGMLHLREPRVLRCVVLFRETERLWENWLVTGSHRGVLQKSELNTSNVSRQCSQCSHRFIQPAFWHPHERRTAIHDACELERREQANRNHQDCGANRPKSIPWLLQTTCVQSNGIFYVHHGVPRFQSKHVDTQTHTHTHTIAE